VGVEAYEPRLSGGFIVSILFHGALVAAFVTLRPGSSPPAPPVFKVQLIAMPAPVAKPTPPPAAPPITKKAAPKAAPTKKTPAPAPTTAAPPAAAPPPAAVGRGSDVTNLVTAGIEFPYPGYINNIANSILKDFAVIHTGGGALRAEVSFIIRRDGTVDPESIRLVKSSGVFSFNQDALAAVEAAANRRAFGPLPPSFREDILPVRFSFDPSTIRR
jgi:hypothetical protein